MLSRGFFKLDMHAYATAEQKAEMHSVNNFPYYM